MGPPLPSREAAIFKRILKFYELKQYKNGLKAAKLILDKKEFAEHGETLAMKGLTLNCLDRKEEAYDYVRRGLRNDLKSHVCWHVYGLLYRSDKNYPEAIKCYRNALKFDPENLQILRDLSLLQVQTRDVEGYLATRNTLLQIRPQQRVSWLGYSIALQLSGQLNRAIDVITAYEKAQESSGNEKKRGYDYETSELMLFKATLMVENKQAQEALDFLAENDKRIHDRLSLKEMRAQLYIEVGQLDKAEVLYRGMMDENPEDRRYYEGLETCLGFDDSSPQEKRLEMYTDMATRHPRAHTPKRLPLAFAKGETFEKLLAAYIKPNMLKGVTPIFRNVAHLYQYPDKVAVLDKLTKEYVAEVEAQREASGDKSPPSHYVWTLLFAAQHYDKLGNHVLALETINKAIDHTPTVLELYMAKAKIYKHAGNVHEAAHWLDYARELDTADRFINSKAVKYLLRAGNIKRAEENVAMFTRETADAIQQLTDMQCMWFETEEGLAFNRVGERGKALKKFHAVDKHFAQMMEDEFDFHTYCLRKMTLRSYTRLIRMEDKLRGHRFYVKAALNAIETYVGLYDNPVKSKQEKEADKVAAMSPADRKKYLRKQKKAELKAEQAKKEEKTTVNKSKADAAKKVDTDPDGEQLVLTKTPLDEAVKFLKPLQSLSPELAEGHHAAYEIYERKRRILLMLQSVKRACKCNAQHPKTHAIKLRLVGCYAEMADTLNPVVKQVVDTELEKLFPEGLDAAACNQAFVKANAASLPHVAAAVEVANAKAHPALVKKLLALASAKDATAVQGRNIKACTEIFQRADKLRLSAKETDALKTSFHACFPLARVFDPKAAEEDAAAAAAAEGADPPAES